ncbi:MAG: 4Fe-4S dicluster domain-containing protein [Halanaerobiales bacterium]
MGIKDTPREEIPWFPRIDEEKCTGCGTCLDFCGHGTYEWDDEVERPVVANSYNCVVGCSSCRNQCPEDAIEFPPLTMLKKYK